jgi:hypothetical protein
MTLSSFSPVLGVISGIVALFVDGKNKKQRWIMIVTICVIGAATIWFNARNEDQASTAKKAEAAAAAASLAQLGDKFDQLKEQVLKSAGVRDPRSADPQQVDVTLRANERRDQIAPNLRANPDHLTIQFFPHLKEDVNTPVVIAALQQALTGRVDINQVQGNPTLANTPTNCIWVGRNVSLEEARTVALTLRAAGVQLRDIRALSNGTGAQARMIQIGSSARVVDKPVLSPDDIASRTVTQVTDPGH